MPIPPGTPRDALDRRTITQGDFFWPLVAIAALIVLVLSLSVHFAVGAFDHESTEREQVLAQSGIEQRISEVAQMAVPQTVWDDAVVNLDNGWNEKWADDNIGKYLNQTSGFDSSFVIDAEGELRYASMNGVKTAPATYERIAPLAAPLIQDVRRAEQKRGTLVRGTSQQMISHAIQASGLRIVNRKLVVLTATLVQPDFGTALPSKVRSPIVVTTMDIDPAFVSLFSRRFLLAGLHVHADGIAPAAGEAEIPLRDNDGRTIAWLAWQPLNPGYQMLRHFFPPILAVCLILIVFAAFQLRRIQRFATILIARDAYSREMAYYDRITTLPNAAYLAERLAEESASLLPHQAYSLHIMDFDLTGVPVTERDRYVLSIAATLVDSCSASAFVARIEGGRFGIINPFMNAVQALGFAARHRQPVLVADPRTNAVTLLEPSIGFTTVIDPMLTVRQIIDRAEIALARDADGDAMEDAAA